MTEQITRETKYGLRTFQSEAHYQEFLRQTGDYSHDQALGVVHQERDGKDVRVNTKPLIAHVSTAEQSEGILKGTVQDAKQHMRRSDAMQKLVEETLLTRVQPGAGADVEYISFDTWVKLKGDFEEAIRVGESVDSATRRTGFQPLNFYVDKIIRPEKDGKPAKTIRPLLMNEVGIRPNGKIICLQDRLPGDVGTLVVGAHKGRPQDEG